MTKKELNEIREQSLSELDTSLKEKKSELFNLRFQLATGQLENTAAIQRCKREIAQVKTVIRQREMSQA